MPLFVNLDAGALEAEGLGLGHAADGPDEVVEVRQLALAGVVLVVHRQLAGGRVLVDARLRRVLVQVHAQALVLGGDAVLDHGVEVAQEGAVTDEEVGLDAEGVEHAGELDSNVAGADEGDLLGQGGDVEEAVAVDAVLGAGDVGEARGATADGDDDAVRAHRGLGAVVLGDLDLVSRQQLGAAVDVLDLVGGQVALVDAVESLHVGVALRLERGPVEGGRLLDLEAVILALVYGLGDGGGVEGDLFRYAASFFGYMLASDDSVCIACYLTPFFFQFSFSLLYPFFLAHFDDIRHYTLSLSLSYSHTYTHSHTYINSINGYRATYPTLTHVPPSLFDSTIMALVPNFPLAMRAAPRPPLPPPMTRKSVSLEIGAMVREDEENCLEREDMREAAVSEKRLLVDAVIATIVGPEADAKANGDAEADADAEESLPIRANACIYIQHGQEREERKAEGEEGVYRYWYW